MAVLDVLNLNLGTEQNPNWVLHDLHDKRISTTAVTTATHLLATNAGVTAMNPITAANLASVLGGYITQMPGYNYNNVSTDVDNLPYGIHRGGNLQGTPSVNGILVVLRTDSSLTSVHTQIFYDMGGGITYIRGGYSGHWTGWMNITLTGQYSNLSSLASALGAVQIYISKNTDFNNFTQQGVTYVCGSGSTTTSLSNRPSGLVESFILVAPTPTVQIIITTWSELKLYKRSYDNGWQKWQLVTGTPVEYA